MTFLRSSRLAGDSIAAAIATACLFVGAQAHAQAAPAAPASPATAPASPAAEAAPATPAAPASAATPADTIALPEFEGLVIEPGGLTANQTAERAVKVSSDLTQKRAELDAANAKISQTMYQFFPQLVVRATYTRLSPVAAEFGQGALVGAQNAGPLRVAPCAMGGGDCVVDAEGSQVGAASFEIENLSNNYALGASLSIPLSDYILRLSDAAASAEASRDAARLALEAERRRVDTDARVLYYNWLRAHGQVAIAHKALQRTKARLEDARAVLSVGSLTQADVMRIEAAVASSELAVQQAEAFRALVRAQLAIIMSDMGPADYRVGEPVPAVLPSVPADGDSHALLAEAWSKRPELKAIDATIAALEDGQDALRVGAYPRLDAVGDASYANPNPRYFPPSDEWNATWSVGLAASWNITEAFSTGAKTDELAAQTTSMRGKRVTAQAGIANQVVTSVIELRNAEAALRTSETTVRATEEAYRVTSDRFRVGRATTTDMVSAETDLLGAKQTSVNARIDIAIAALRLQHALGRETAKQ